ncbi:replication-relaxation family protein [Alicyclobacillus sp. SO9]|uniref:replication-relaxation family protein n=1 Tax=Alicyclobacillus sp. SO9 TaxID=2665646 RepID=UPI0018E71A29|nr:replication-relaxation family protein [Alicyclobacillus sp. SO9]QQE79726.1 replication-relaxation family protein [Alicyclobacillus sp. SO9]
MILHWPSTHFKPEEQLLGILFDGGIMTREQIAGVSDFSLRKVRYCRDRARRLSGERPTQRFIVAGGRKNGVAYALTRSGMRYVYEMLGYENQRIQVVPEGQVVHYLGINNILLRAVEVFGREDIEWLSTRELAEELELRRRLQGKKDIYRGRAIRPDASIRIGTQDPVWVEYDNNTESTAKLERKFTAYWHLRQELGTNMRTVLWVTATERRRNYLERVYQAIAKIHGWDNSMQHQFFIEGDDTQWLKTIQSEFVNKKNQRGNN